MSKSKDAAIMTLASRRYWRTRDAEAVVSAWRESGVSVAAFARQHGMQAARVLRWRSRLGGKKAIQFRPVRMVSASTRVDLGDADVLVELVTRSGRRIAVRRGFDARLLEELVRAVESWSC